MARRRCLLMILRLKISGNPFLFSPFLLHPVDSEQVQLQLTLVSQGDEVEDDSHCRRQGKQDGVGQEIIIKRCHLAQQIPVERDKEHRQEGEQHRHERENDEESARGDDHAENPLDPIQHRRCGARRQGDRHQEGGHGQSGGVPKHQQTAQRPQRDHDIGEIHRARGGAGDVSQHRKAGRAGVFQEAEKADRIEQLAVRLEEQMRVKSEEERENAGDDGGTVGNADARKTCGGTASHGFAVSAGGVSLPSIRNAASMSAQTSA